MNNNKKITSFLPNFSAKKEKESKTVSAYYKKLVDYKYKLVNEFNEYVKVKVCEGFNGSEDIDLHNRYLEYYNRLTIFMGIIWTIDNRKITQNEYFKNCNNSKYSESWFNYFKKRVNKYLDKEWFIESKYSVHHPIRTSPRPIGEIQLDIKELGYEQSGTGKHEFILDAICVGSRYARGHTLYRCTTEEIMAKVIMIKKEFEQARIKIHTIQTDNAMVFNKNNFVVSDVFNNWCDENNIKHLFIIKNQPQQNGCIERFHLIYDKELVSNLINCKTTYEIECELQRFYEYYNYERLHYYIENKHLVFDLRYMTPIQALNFFRYNIAV